jgi:hypothetical protein
LEVSATKAKSPSGEKLTPVGLLKSAVDPMPFARPEDPPPARVDTSAVERTRRRMRLLEVSATNTREPSGEMLTPRGLLNCEFVPIPSVEPGDGLPAKTVTEAEEITMWRSM